MIAALWKILQSFLPGNYLVTSSQSVISPVKMDFTWSLESSSRSLSLFTMTAIPIFCNLCSFNTFLCFLVLQLTGCHSDITYTLCCAIDSCCGVADLNFYCDVLFAFLIASASFSITGPTEEDPITTTLPFASPALYASAFHLPLM
mgnify:CR=1 FL=1